MSKIEIVYKAKVNFSRDPWWLYRPNLDLLLSMLSSLNYNPVSKDRSSGAHSIGDENKCL